MDRRAEVVLFILVMALAAFLRLYRLDLIDVRFDEASAPQLALSITRGNWLPVAPFSGSVANHPPVYLYLLALPYLFTRDFMTLAAYRALLDVAALALCWVVCRRFFNLRVALIACLLFAVAPWAIQFARKTWLAPVPLFSVVLLFGLLEAIQKRNPWGWAIAGWGLALSVGSHLAAIYLAPVVLVALVIGRRTLRALPCAIGLLPLFALTAAYFGFDAGQDFRNVRALLGTASGEAAWSLDALRFALWSSGGAHLSDLTGGAFPIWQTQMPPILGVIDLLQMAMLVLSMGMLLALSVQRRSFFPGAAVALLLLWLIVPVALQVRTSRPLQIHYFTILYPAPFIVTALGVDAIIRSMRTQTMRSVAGWASAMTIALVAGWQLFTMARFTQFIQQYDTSAGGYGPPVRSALDVTQLAREAIRAGKINDVIVVAPGGDPSVNEPATLMDVLLAGAPHRFVDSEAGLILREDGAQYIFTPDTERAFDALEQNANPSAVVTQTLALRAGSDRSYVYARVNQVKLAPMVERSALWANGVGLLGYRVEGDNPLLLNVYLRAFREAEANANVHWFNHVYKGDERVVQLDGGGIHPSNWRAGDILLQWFDIALPADAPPKPYVLRIGAYRYPELQNVPVVDAAGQPISDRVELAVER